MNATALEISVLGTQFRNPVLLAAGTAGFGRELSGVMDLDRLGGLVTKAVSPDARAGNPAPRVAEFAGGMLNSVGLANPGLDAVCLDHLPWLAREHPTLPVIVNVVGNTVEDYRRVVAGISALPGITALELNLSCPNSSAGGLEFGAEPASVAAVVGACRRATPLPILAKLSPALPDIASMAVVATESGADGVTLVNTMPGYLFAGGTASPRLGNGNGGVSGPALLPVGVLATRRVRERLPATVIIGVGGVRSAADLQQFRQAGANLVAIGTATLADPRLPGRIIDELERRGG